MPISSFQGLSTSDVGTLNQCIISHAADFFGIITAARLSVRSILGQRQSHSTRSVIQWVFEQKHDRLLHGTGRVWRDEMRFAAAPSGV